MKLILLTLFSLCFSKLLTKQIISQKMPIVQDQIPSQEFLNKQVNDHKNLLNSIENYINKENLNKQYVLNYPNYSYQQNLNYIEPANLRGLVQRVIYSKPISQWPMVIRYMVFPNIYGFYSNNIIQGYLDKLFQNQGILFDNASIEEEYVFSAKDRVKLDLLERLSQLENLKKEIDHNLASQTKGLLEGRDYEEKVFTLFDKVHQNLAQSREFETIFEQFI